MRDLESLLSEKLQNACITGNLEIIKHFLKSPQLKNTVVDSLKSSLDIYLLPSIKNQRIEVLDYLLSQKEIAHNKMALREIFSNEFCDACYRNNLETVKFIFFGKFKEYLDISYSNYWCFRTAYKNERSDVLTLLIMDAGISKYIPAVLSCMQREKSKLHDFCNELFDKANLKKMLEKGLKSNKIASTKIKI